MPQIWIHWRGTADAASSDPQPVSGTVHTPWLATDHEINHGRDIAWMLRAKPAPEPIREAWLSGGWILEMTADGSSDGKPFRTTHLFLASLRTTPEVLLRLVQNRLSIGGWHWIRATQLHGGSHRYRPHGTGVRTTRRTTAMKLLRLGGFRCIQAC